MTALAEKTPGERLQLRHDDALGAVDHERPRGHVRDLAEIHILHDGFEILVLGVGAVEFSLPSAVRWGETTRKYTRRSSNVAGLKQSRNSRTGSCSANP